MSKQEWKEYITNYISNDKYNRAISWHVRLDLEDKFSYNTAKINYELDKLVKDGYLNKETTKYCTIYTLKNEQT